VGTEPELGGAGGGVEGAERNIGNDEEGTLGRVSGETENKG
jgi:hypothetical protein